MTRRARTSFGVAATLAVFGLLCGCGQRGPLTLSESQRPIQRLDKGGTVTPESPPPTGAPGAGTSPEPPPGGAPGATPRPEDDEPKQ